jgi:uncharacterized protein (TIGR03000 family)
MSRWMAVVVTVLLFGPVRTSEGRVIHHCRGTFSTPPSDGVAGGDWSSGYMVDFGFAAVAPTAGGGNGQAIPPTNRPRQATPPKTQPTAPPAAPARLHVLLLVDDTNKDAGPANKAGAALLEKTIRAGLSDDRLGTVETISGSAVSIDQIRGRINAFGVRSQDIVIGYYTGAAEYDEPTRSYTLTPAAGSRIKRADLRAMLLSPGAALTVLLTDTPAFRVIPEMVPPYQPAAGPFSLDRLMFRNRGVVDLQAAAANEQAFPRDGEGGLFTLALVDELRQLKADGPDPTWPALVERVRATTDRMYVDYRRAVLTSDKVAADEKRAYREQPHQMPAILTPLDKIAPVSPPAAVPITASAQPAEIVVHVPAKAKVFVEDRPTKLAGPERRFETADLQRGRAYTYSIRAELDRDGRTLTETKRVTVRAGETADVRFELAN